MRARNTSDPNTFHLVLFGAFLAMLFARSWQSFAKLPADPGYGYVSDASRDGVQSLTIGDPYFHLAARAIAWLTSFAPLEWQAVVLSTLVHFVWAACSVYIVYITSLEAIPRWVSAIAGSMLILAPHASESSLGNVGNVKWPLLAAAMVLCSSTRVLTLHRVSSIALLVVTGLTQPLGLLCVIPLLRLGLKSGVDRRRLLPIISAVLGTSVLQFLKVGPTAATSGRDARVVEPWDGMGIFWWSGLLGPIMVACVTLALVWVGKPRSDGIRTLATNLSIGAVVLGGITYRMGGIADRYFVVPLTLALIAALLALCDLSAIGARSRTVAVAASIALILVPTLKWFSASHYLSSGPTWSAEVRNSQELCSTSTLQLVEIKIAGNSSVQLECEYVLRG
jgi:hypothetical protein